MPRPCVTFHVLVQDYREFCVLFLHRLQPRPVCVDSLLQPCDRLGKGIHGEGIMRWFGGFEVAVRAPRHPRRGAQVGAPPHDHGNRGDVAEGAREGG